MHIYAYIYISEKIDGGVGGVQPPSYFLQTPPGDCIKICWGGQALTPPSREKCRGGSSF